MREGGASVYARSPLNLYNRRGKPQQIYTIKQSFHLVLLSCTSAILPYYSTVFLLFRISCKESYPRGLGKFNQLFKAAPHIIYILYRVLSGSNRRNNKFSQVFSSIIRVKERAKLKSSISRLVTILFPELETLVPKLHMPSVYALLSEFPGASYVASAHLTKLTHLLSEASKGRYNKETAILFREAAKTSIGSVMPAKSLELKHTIKLIQELTSEIDEIESEIKRIMDEIESPILTIPGISYRMGAMILAEIGDFSRFDSPDKILAYAGMSPSTYQSGQLTNCHSHMEKRGSRYLRYALYNATKYVCHWDTSFRIYLEKKRSEGKHYNVALSHATKKLVRLIFALEKSKKAYLPAV